MEPKFNLGDRVIVTGVVEKTHVYNSETRLTETSFPVHAIPTIVGIYIGKRTAQFGSILYGEDGPEFSPRGHQSYYLVVTNERQNPIKAHPGFIV